LWNYSNWNWRSIFLQTTATKNIINNNNLWQCIIYKFINTTLLWFCNNVLIKNNDQNSILCGMGEKWAIFQSRVTFVPRAAGEDHISPKTKIAFPHEPPILFFVTTQRSSITEKILQGSMQQPNYSTKTIFYERNYLDIFILSFNHGGYNINIRYNKKCMFCKE